MLKSWAESLEAENDTEFLRKDSQFKLGLK